MTDEVLATVSASVPRRAFGVALLLLLGGLLAYLALSQPLTAMWKLFVAVVGIAILLLGEKMRRATAGHIELTRAGLRDQDGLEMVALDNIRQVERGVFALKPSNGFVLRLHRPVAGREWRPGLWWRYGKRLGVGGVTSGSKTKSMAEIISALMAERDANQG